MDTLWDVSDDQPKTHACSGVHCQVCLADTVLPYAGTSGWSGSDTSKARAVGQDSDGTTSRRQSETLKALEVSGHAGMTWKDLSDTLSLHHGSSSGLLSVLHKAGKIERLRQSRDKCKVYVHPDFVDGRETENQGRSKCCPHCGGDI